MSDYGYPKAREIVSEYLRQLDEGMQVSQADILRQHTLLADELRAEFRKVDALACSAQTTGGSQDAAAVGGSQSGTIVRCPHCNRAVNASLSESFKVFECHACKNEFSLLRERKWPSKINNFELVERLGMGGFGTVWKAHDKELDRFVALKLPRHRHPDGNEGEQFLNEARTAAKLDHPNIVRVLEVGRVEDDDIYIASELIEGDPLSSRIGNGLPETEALPIALQLAQALTYAHAERVIHRDLKPQNVLIDKQGKPHLSDFGLAGHSTTDATLTMTSNGQVFGTPNYMSPEQARGEQVDERTDIYSFGVLLYETLTGQVPFQGTLPNILRRLDSEDPIHPKKLNDRLSRDLDTICMKCLEKAPERRYQSAAELTSELQRLANGIPIKSRPVGTAERLMRWAKRNPVVAGISGVAGVAFLTAAALLGTLSAQRQVTEVEVRSAEIAKLKEALAGRAVGYRNDLFKSLDDSQMLKDVTFHNAARPVAVAAMGDFAGFYPIHFDDDGLSTVAISADGNWLAIAFDRLLNDDQSIKRKARIEIRQTSDIDHLVEELHSDNWNHGRPIALRFPNNSSTKLVSLDNQGFLTLFDWSDLEIKIEEVARLRYFELDDNNKPKQKINSGMISADGVYVAFCDDTSVAVYDLSLRTRVFDEDIFSTSEQESKNADEPKFKNVAISEDGRYLAAGHEYSGSYGGLHRWDLQNAGEPEYIESDRGGRYPNGLTFDAKGKFLAAGGERTSQFEVEPMEERQFFEISEAAALAYCPDEKHLAVALGSDVVQIRQLRSNALVASFPYREPGGMRGVAYNKQGSHLVAWNQKGVQVVRFRKMRERLDLTGHQRALTVMRFTSDGLQLITGGKDGYLRLWDAREGKQISCVDLGSPIQCVAFNPHQTRVAVSQWGRELKLSIFDFPTLTKVRDIDNDLEQICGLAYSPDETKLVATGDGGMRIWNIGGESDFDLVRTYGIKNGIDKGRFLTFVPSGTRIYHAFDWERVGWLDLEDPAEPTLHVLAPGRQLLNGFNSMAFSKAGYLTFVDQYGGLKAWDMTATAKPRIAFDLPASTFEKSTIAISKQGILAALTEASTVSVWHPESGTMIYEFRPEVTPVWALEWSPDGEKLAIGRSDGGLSIWNLREVHAQLTELGFNEGLLKLPWAPTED